MANIISVGTGGNFTTAATWQTSDSLAELDSEAGSTAIGTATTNSSTWTTDVSVIDAVCIKLAARVASPTGTFKVIIRNTTLSSDVATVTVNVADLPASGLGWQTFKLSSPITLLTGSAYAIGVSCSVASEVTLYRNGTAGNWSRKLRTTTTQAPASGNHIVVSNELTGAGTHNTCVVTMDNTATTSFGPTVSGGPPQGVVVSGGGTINWGTTASTAYYLKWKGIFLITGNGTVNIGSSGTRIPATSSAIMEMDSVAALDSKFMITTGGTFNAYGAVRTPYVTLTADIAAAATGIATTSATGWLAGDIVAFSASGNSGATHEQQTIATVVSTSSITLSTGVTNAHSGTAPQAGYVLNMTRNITFRGTTTTAANHGNFTALPLGTVYVEYVYFDIDKLGSSAGTIGSSCIDVETTTGSCTLKGCCGLGVFSGTGNGGAYVLFVSGASSNNWTIDTCVFYNWNQRIFVWNTTTESNWSHINCFAMKAGSAGYLIGSYRGTITGLKVYTASTGIDTVNEATDADFSTNSLDSWEAAYCTIGLSQNTNNQSLYPIITYSNLKLYFNVTGLLMQAAVRRIVINTCSIFGNTTNIQFNNAVRYLEINSGTIASSTVITSQSGISANPATNPTWIVYLVLNNCTFGVVTGIFSGHSTGDITLQTNPSTYTTLQVYANNCNFASTTQFPNFTVTDQANQGDLIDRAGSFIRMQNYGQTAGDHRTFTPRGNVQLDTVIYHTASPSERLTPVNASYKLASGPQIASCGSSTTRVFAAWIRTSTSTDSGGANYTGNAPRLMLVKNYAMGQQTTTNIALATHTATTGVWAQVSGTCTTALEDGAWEVYVDCDGTAGWVNVDDWTAS